MVCVSSILKLPAVFIAIYSAILLVVHVHALPSDLDSIQTRIVNGQTSALGQFPYQALLFIRTASGSAVCGGSLISNEWVLTAAHCAQSAIEFQVHLGAINLRDNGEPTRTVVTTRTKIVHNNYNARTVRNDVALIKLTPPIAFTDKIQAIKLPAKGSGEFVDRIAVASGWGAQADGGSVAQKLQWASMRVIANKDCARLYGSNIIKESILCGQGSSSPKGSVCQGDSGMYSQMFNIFRT